MGEKKREDSWLDEHDQILSETVLSHIRTGSTQLAAFEEAASQIKRTASACGFRWNKELRKQYENDLLEAKQNRIKQKSERSFNKQEKLKEQPLVSISNVSVTADNQNPNVQPVGTNEVLLQIIKLANEQIQKYDELLQENNRLKEENNELKSKQQTEDPDILAKEDLDAFLQIMKRAKSLTHV